MLSAKSSLKNSASILAFVSGLVIGAAAHAGALPSAGHFVAGIGSIAKKTNGLTINQSSTSGIIDWQGFSIGKNNDVRFDNGSGATLNRVTGGNLSTIAGSLRATGSVYLINPQGMIVSQGGRVLTGGDFIGSSRNLSEDDQQNDRRRFTGNSRGNVVNGGVIRSNGGDVILIGNAARNSGEIAARNGTAAMISGNDILLKPVGSDQRLAVKSGAGSVMNRGSIDAASVELRAAGGNVYALAGNNGGLIRATGTKNIDGHIWLISSAGETKISGSIIARNVDSAGGAIETSGHNVSLGGKIDAGRGGTWLVDPVNLTVTSSAATTIDNSLNAGTNVSLKTTKTTASGAGTKSSGPGDIVIAAAMTWNSTAQLTLDSYHSILIDHLVALAGKGKLALTTNHGSSGGALSFSGGKVTFANLASTLTINGANYTLVKTIGALANDITAHPTGNFALAQDYSATTGYAAAPIATAFSGKFEGLGNTISNLDIVAGAGHADVGLFAVENASGVIENLALTNVTVTGGSGTTAAGALAGVAKGTIRNVIVSGGVSATRSDSAAGGLVGDLAGGTISGSRSSATVDAPANAGGLIGETESGKVTGSSASGKVTGGSGGNAGGLVGIMNSGSIGSSFATGATKASGAGAWVGGLVGEMDGTSAITKSHATGAISGAGNTAGYGGLVGYMGVASHDTISNSYAFGQVSGGGTNTGVGGLVGYIDYNGSNSITGSYATGAVTGTDSTNDGGLVGFIYYGGTNHIAQTYATGAVSGGAHSDVGGLVGYNAASIIASYATGKLTGGMSSTIGGLIGYSYSTGPGIYTAASSSYWDTQTTGISNLAQGAGNTNNIAGVSGKTTAQLKAGLPAGFSSTYWAVDASINGGFPYLKALLSSY